ncbi:MULTISPECIES: aldo/keto reductase [unclassified Rhodococcus (in: high G+C Gram-positive bacteria)]|uniref:aldo/keto reductase n=1 Tax=unclassified Rhodococcus (in: high G+C Gram-positive bacteria) TaxID=192944 RepID=UPI001639FABE|nr:MULTISPECIES: aldo/keto reductase [unclassified Rhodococcus (in: high G+C Gram-positive bacteria)]MBC2642183.1 aldo/keto reductase [Rhodococcus sp. 3A]MBC2893075.1 aldo/keto reductase [Rhodococcus sp. 4CII]
MPELDLTSFVLGTMTFGDTVDFDGAAAMVDAALDAGITHIDTANGYAGGESERILARLLAGRRDRVTLATKAGMPHPDAGDNSPLSPAGLRSSVEASLKRLDTDYVDLFHLHQPDRATPLADTLSTVADLVSEGKIRALGVSNFAAWQIAEVNHTADAVGAPRPIVAQQLYNLLARRIEEEYVEFAAVTGLITMVYNPLGGGLLTGRHSFDAKPADGRFGDSRLAQMYKERYWNTAIFDAIQQLSVIADKAGIPLTELALRWLVSKPAAGPILLGGSKVAHLQSNIAAVAKGRLDDELIDACDEVGSALRGPMPNYNR